MIAPAVVVLDEGRYLTLELPRSLPDNQIDAFLAGTMVTLDFSVRLGMIR